MSRSARASTVAALVLASALSAILLAGPSGYVGLMPEVVVVAEGPQFVCPEVVCVAEVPDHLRGVMPEVVVVAEGPRMILDEVVVTAPAPVRSEIAGLTDRVEGIYY